MPSSSARIPIVLLLLLFPVAASAKRAPLEPLYQRIAADLKLGRPLVATVHVALCDNSIIRCGGRGFGNGDNPRRNLYWGGAAGLKAIFARASGWKRIHRDAGDGKVILERLVYRRRVRPGRRWRALGVTRPFDLLLVGLAYRGKAIDKATRNLIDEVIRGKGGSISFEGRRIPLGAAGHIVGYAGHNHLMDLLGEYPWPGVARSHPLGYFALSCMNASYLTTRLCRGEVPAVGLLLTRTLMYPGAFTIRGLLEGIARAEALEQVHRRGVSAYARAQKRPLGAMLRAFTHDRSRRFTRDFGACSAPATH